MQARTEGTGRAFEPSSTKRQVVGVAALIGPGLALFCAAIAVAGGADRSASLDLFGLATVLGSGLALTLLCQTGFRLPQGLIGPRRRASLVPCAAPCLIGLAPRRIETATQRGPD